MDEHAQGLQQCIDIIKEHNITLLEVVKVIFGPKKADLQPLREHTLAALPNLLDLFAKEDDSLPIPLPPGPHPPISPFTGWVLSHATRVFKAEVVRLSHISSGYHANASNFTLEQVEDFSTVNLYQAFSESAPALTCMVGCLLDAMGYSNVRAQNDPPPNAEVEPLPGGGNDTDNDANNGHDQDGAAEEGLGYNDVVQLNIWLDEQERIFMAANPAAPTSAQAIQQRREKEKKDRMAANRNSALSRIVSRSQLARNSLWAVRFG